jgi:hypothetical protein
MEILGGNGSRRNKARWYLRNGQKGFMSAKMAYRLAISDLICFSHRNLAMETISGGAVKWRA